MEYIGEHLLPGKIGHLLIVLAFTSSLLAGLAYYFATQRHALDEAVGWRRIGRIAFSLHGLGILGAIGVIFYIMLKQYYEYQYVWAHVSEELPFRYIFSAFWEGQEGSFLLWMFWHVILGWVLMKKAGEWEAPVIAVLSLVQLFIISMIVGIHFNFGESTFRLGGSPFLLLRDVMDAPIFATADYVSLIKGQGLNPLLQNYWMTIHPPVLFLGFASTVVPFCYAIAGLWTGRYRAWLKPVLPWALFSGATLGIGILMGGAWAYEALSFGGYWAWDPVENMSLVPWLVLLAGIHTNLIGKSTGHSIKSSFLFYLLTFVLIVYSTFLTRSGVLGDTSVHAFTEMGLEWQLVAFIFTFLGLSLILFFKNFKSIPSPEKEESVGSKEFWMFIGSLVLLFSAALITASTSLPVYNKIYQYFDPGYLGGVIQDPVEHYNKYQLWIALFVGFFSGAAQYMRYREEDWNRAIRRFSRSFLAVSAIAALLTWLASLWIEARAWQYLLLLFSALFAVVANLDYLIRFLKGNLKTAGSAIAHIGFGLMIVGIMASGLNKHHISTNAFAQRGIIEGFTEEDYKKNVILLKGVPMLMSGYEVTYEGDTIDGFTRSFEVSYKKKGTEGDVLEQFALRPNVLYDKDFSKIAASNPSTKRYLDKDIFTHIASLPLVDTDPEYAKQMEDSLDYVLHELGVGDSIVAENYTAIVEAINYKPVHPDYQPEKSDLRIGLKLRITGPEQEAYHVAEPMLALRENLLYSYPAQINELNMRVRLPEVIFSEIFTPEQSLTYRNYMLKQGEAFKLNGYQITFEGFNTQPRHPNYTFEEGDLPVSAQLAVRTPSGESLLAQPLYFIRDSRPYNIKDYLSKEGLHFRFTEIDPKTEEVTIKVALTEPKAETVSVEIAENSLRSDYIVLEAIVFPGINLFWLGSVLMMLGLGISMFRRIKRS